MKSAARAPGVVALISTNVSITWSTWGVSHAPVAQGRRFSRGKVERERVVKAQVLPAVVSGEQPALERACAVSRDGRSTPGANASRRYVPKFAVFILSEFGDGAEVTLSSARVEHSYIPDPMPETFN